MKTCPAAALILLIIVMAGCDTKTASPPPAPASHNSSQPPSTPPSTGKPTLDTSHADKVSTTLPPGERPKGMVISAQMPFVIQNGMHGNLELDPNDSHTILNGQDTLDPKAKVPGLEKTLRIERFATTPDTVTLQLDAGPSSPTTLVGANPADGAAPALIDTKGGSYNPVGYIYEDETKLTIRFTPGEPTKFADLPSMTRSRPAQKLILVYRVSRGVSLKHFVLDRTAIAQYDPPLLMDQSQK